MAVNVLSNPFCSRCNRLVSTKVHLVRHIKLVHEHCQRYETECHVCGKVCSKSSNLDRHLWLHGTTQFKCSKCEAKFTRSDYLKSHLSKVHGASAPQIAIRKCKICGKNFANFRSLCQHNYTCHAANEFKCRICGELFTNWRKLRRHKSHFHPKYMGTIEFDKDYCCARCSQPFVTKSNLLEHIRFVHELLHHLNETPKFICHKCGIDFGQLGDLNEHLECHQRKYKCSKCPATFKRSREVNGHMRYLHKSSAEVIYKCAECNRTFQRSNQLKCHSIYHRPPQFSCDYCDCRLFTTSSLRIHLKVAHSRHGRGKNIVKCKTRRLSKKPLTNDSDVYDSSQRKFTCKFCRAKFCRQAKLQSHLIRLHSNQLWKTPASYVISYTCAVCCRPFGYKSDLRKHLKRHCQRN